MTAMSSRRPRRQRRRPRERASTLPRPAADAADRPAPVVPSASAPARAPSRPVPRERVEHHVAADYRYVRRDLAVVGVVSAITLAFVLIAAVLA